MLKSLIAALDLAGRKKALDELHKNEVRLKEAERIAHFGWWEREFTTNRVLLSDELCRIFGVQPAAIPEWHQRWLNLIHPEDRSKVAEAAATALGGGPRYDVEYRVVRPDGAVRIVHSRGDVTWGRKLKTFTPPASCRISLSSGWQSKRCAQAKRGFASLWTTRRTRSSFLTTD